MTKATQFVSYATAFTAAWLACLMGWAPLPAKVANEIVPALPLWVIVSFGAYSLGTIGLGLMTFGDCPEAHCELMQEVAQAKADLKSKRITIDS
ncbi:hypothetical protein RI367_007341 [Sorochytrium milnesiophthora]